MQEKLLDVPISMAGEYKKLMVPSYKKAKEPKDLPRHIPGRKLQQVPIWEMWKARHRLKIPKERIGVNLFKGYTVVVSRQDYQKVVAINGWLSKQVILYPYCKWPYVILHTNTTEWEQNTQSS